MVTEELLLAAFVLGGLRHTDHRLTDLYRRLNMTLEDSTTYQWIIRKGLQQGLQEGKQQGLEQGRSVEAQNVVLRLGRKRFGDEPTAELRVRAIADIDRLERISDRLLDATGWDDLLGTP